jgi:hypothetical protein
MTWQRDTIVHRLLPAALFCTALFPGCLTDAARPARHEAAQYLGEAPPLAVNVAYVRSTGVHFWQDPDPTPFGPMRPTSLTLVMKDQPSVHQPPARTGGLYPLLTWQEATGVLLLAPGYNPVRVYDLTSRMADAIIQADNEFAMEHPYDIRSPRPNRVVPFDRERNVLLITWTRLPTTTEEVQKGFQVDHGFLVCLLQEDALWDYLERTAAQGPKESRQAVDLVCHTILDMMKAHDLQWPGFQWTGRHQQIRSWCEKPLASGEN